MPTFRVAVVCVATMRNEFDVEAETGSEAEDKAKELAQHIQFDADDWDYEVDECDDITAEGGKDDSSGRDDG